MFVYMFQIHLTTITEMHILFNEDGETYAYQPCVCVCIIMHIPIPDIAHKNNNPLA